MGSFSELWHHVARLNVGFRVSGLGFVECEFHMGAGGLEKWLSNA